MHLWCRIHKSIWDAIHVGVNGANYIKEWNRLASLKQLLLTSHIRDVQDISILAWHQKYMGVWRVCVLDCYGQGDFILIELQYLDKILTLKRFPEHLESLPARALANQGRETRALTSTRSRMLKKVGSLWMSRLTSRSGIGAILKEGVMPRSPCGITYPRPIPFFHHHDVW